MDWELKTFCFGFYFGVSQNLGTLLWGSQDFRVYRSGVPFFRETTFQSRGDSREIPFYSASILRVLKRPRTLNPKP